MSRKPREPGRDAVPVLEWIAAGLGLVVVLALLAILGREIARGEADDVPLLAARIEAVRPTQSSHVATFIVVNRSSQTAAAVQVEGKLGDEVATATLDYVPGHSEARGGLLFEGDPRFGVELRVVGYELP